MSEKIITKFWEGKQFSEEHKKNISKALKGKLPKFIPNNKGIKRTEENKRKISETLRKRGIKPPDQTGFHHSIQTREKMSARIMGNKHFNWKGGITYNNQQKRKCIEMILWRECVFTRDNWVCQKCKISGGILRAHHIFNFATFLDLRFAIDNGITFCNDCHKKFHKQYGYNNNTKGQLEEFLKDIKAKVYGNNTGGSH